MAVSSGENHTFVLIVGAGPTGLTLACDLARRGVPHRIVDREAGPRLGSRGKGLQPRTLEVLDDLGLVAEVLANSGTALPYRTYSGDDPRLDGPAPELAEPTDATPFANAVTIPQWRLEEILRTRLSELGGRVVSCTELVDFESTPDGVHASLRYAGTDSVVRPRYLVGADGARSFVRKHLGVTFPGSVQDAPATLVGDVKVTGLDRERSHIWPLAEGGPVALFPLPATDFFQFSAFAHGACPESLDELRATFRLRTGCSTVRLLEIGSLSIYRPSIRMADRFRVGPVFLCGDAAHIHPPAGAQGMNTGIQDAYNLGWKLAHVFHGGSDSLLDTYEAERLPAVAQILGTVAELYQEALAGRIGTKRDSTRTHQLGLNYRSGPLAAGEYPASPVQAGDRVPDASGQDNAGNPVRVFDLVRGPHWTLLIFGVTCLAVEKLCGDHGDALHVHHVVRPGEPALPGDFVDVYGQLRQTYRAEDGVLVLIRPDGYVGFLGTDRSAESVSRYLSAAFAPADASAVGGQQ